MYVLLRIVRVSTLPLICIEFQIKQMLNVTDEWGRRATIRTVHLVTKTEC
jgi:hypothetical protein